MKRLFAGLLALMAVFALAGCGPVMTEEPDPTARPKITPTPSQQDIIAQAAEVLAQSVEKELDMGLGYLVFNWSVRNTAVDNAQPYNSATITVGQAAGKYCIIDHTEKTDGYTSFVYYESFRYIDTGTTCKRYHTSQASAQEIHLARLPFLPNLPTWPEHIQEATITKSGRTKTYELLLSRQGNQALRELTWFDSFLSTYAPDIEVRIRVTVNPSNGLAQAIDVVVIGQATSNGAFMEYTVSIDYTHLQDPPELTLPDLSAYTPATP